MACTSCKKRNKTIFDSEIKNSKHNKGVLKKIIEYSVRVLLFLLLSLILIPVLIPITIIFLYRIVVLSKQVDILPVVYHITKRIFENKDDEEDDEEEDEEFNEEDYELENSNEIIVIK